MTKPMLADIAEFEREDAALGERLSALGARLATLRDGLAAAKRADVERQVREIRERAEREAAAVLKNAGFSQGAST